jgi:hypothetical protein
MLNCKSSPTPIDTSPKSSATSYDTSFYCSIIDAM